MPISFRGGATAALLFALLCAAFGARATEISRIDITGLDGAMADNVRQSLSLAEAIGREHSERRLQYLLDAVERETREALEPFGYYAPIVRVRRDGDVVRVAVEAGAPVRVRRRSVAVEGEAGADAVVREDVAAFRPGAGEPLDHVAYEASKGRIGRRLAERGYFDAELARHSVEVTRAQQAADIDLLWRSGARYTMGDVSFSQAPASVVDADLLQKLVSWPKGAPFLQTRVERLRESLQRLDYFAAIDVEIHPENATGRQVPVAVNLTPARRSIYTAGLSYGSDSGAGVRLGMERRYLNRRGHKAQAQLDFAQRRKTLTLQYRIPAFAWLDGWYTLGLQAADEQTDYIDNRRVEFVAGRSGQVSRELNAVAGLHVLRERWAYAAEDDGNPSTPPDYRYASFTYPQLDAAYVGVDNRLMPRRGFGATAAVRGGLGQVEASRRVSVVQARATLQWFHGLGQTSRLITRGELGQTWSDAPVGTLPPSLRFHAGGERSIRGYGWREVGPRVGVQGRRFAVGARNVITSSIEYERYFRPQWGFAVFVDGGSAFNRRPDWHTGVGVGLRWKSPVGPVRIDIARGIKNPDSPFQIYLGLGAEL